MGPYTRIEGPEKLSFPGAVPPLFVSSPETYQAWHAAMIRHNAAPVNRWLSLLPRQARIEHGRWLITCTCQSGVLTRPDWRLGCCIQCGAVYRTIDFPAACHDIERVLLERPCRENQNWLIGQTFLDLLMENAEHGAEIEAFHALQGGL